MLHIIDTAHSHALDSALKASVRLFQKQKLKTTTSNKFQCF